MHRDHICVGDIIRIDSGMQVPVDGVVLQSVGVQVDESAMTGESDHLARESMDRCLLKKKEVEQINGGPVQDAHAVPSCTILSGTNVTVGQGYFVTIVVGERTCEGQILASVEAGSPNEVTPLQMKLEVIAEDIGKLGMFCAILIFHCLMLRSFIEGMTRKDFDLWGGERSAKLGSRCSERQFTSAGQTPANTAVDTFDASALDKSLFVTRNEE